MDEITVAAPASTANLGPGFDVFGLALDCFADIVSVTKTDKPGITITGDDIPTDPAKNTAGIVAGMMTRDLGLPGGLDISITKNVPVGCGLGSSAASAAAAAVAVNMLFDLRLDSNAIVKFAGAGEMASAGTIHYDNVAASAIGNFVLVKTDPLDIITVSPPRDLVLCVSIPLGQRDIEKKTEKARKVLPPSVSLRDHVYNMSNAAAMVSGFFTGDLKLIGSAMRDVIVEPARGRTIPGYDAVRRHAMDAGALGVAISGAGPSMIAFVSGARDAEAVSSSMRKAYDLLGLASRCEICRPAAGAGPLGDSG